jgi:cytochrome c peroxidase
VLTLVGLALAGAAASAAPGGPPYPLPALEERPAELVALGAELFAEPALSLDGSIACASCHRAEHGFADSEPLSRGVGGALTLRNAPSILNRAFGTRQMWDGRAATLLEQVLLPIQDPREMALSLDEAVARLAADERYAVRFDRALGAPPSRDGLARALEAFVASQWLGDSPVDRFRAGDAAALADDERAGLWIYESRGACWRCHGGPNFTDEDFHATGVGARDGALEPGRYAVTGAETDRGRFKTPSLRAAAPSAPYMHDGSLAALEDVVLFYRRDGGATAGLDPLLREVRLEPGDEVFLAAFLRALARPGSPPSPALSGAPEPPSAAR